MVETTPCHAGGALPASGIGTAALTKSDSLMVERFNERAAKGLINGLAGLPISHCLARLSRGARTAPPRPYARRAMGGTEIVKRALEAFNSRDAAAMIALMHPDAEFVPITASMEGRVYSRDQIADFLRSIELDWEVFEARPNDFYELADRALALGSWQARGRGSGLELRSQPGAWLATIRDGLIYPWRTYTERAEALEALGIGEPELAKYRTNAC